MINNTLTCICSSLCSHNYFPLPTGDGWGEGAARRFCLQIRILPNSIFLMPYCLSIFYLRFFAIAQNDICCRAFGTPSPRGRGENFLTSTREFRNSGEGSHTEAQPKDLINNPPTLTLPLKGGRGKLACRLGILARQ